MLINCENACIIATSIAVVRSWEDSHDILLMTPVEPLSLRDTLHSLQADGLALSMRDHLCGWIAQRYPDQMYNQRLLEKYPTHSVHLGHSTISRTLVLHEGLPSYDRVDGFDREYPHWERDLHEVRRSNFKRQQWGGSSQRGLWSTSTHSRSRISSDTRHKSRTPK